MPPAGWKRGMVGTSRSDYQFRTCRGGINAARGMEERNGWYK